MTDTLPAHSQRGPSSAKRWTNCSGSVAATKNLPEKPSKYAAEGTLAHSIAERCRDDGCTAEKMLGEKHVVDGFEFTVEQEMVDGVNVFLEYVRDLGGDWHNELRVHYTEWVSDGFGTSDHIAIKDGIVHVVDLKYGEGVLITAKDDPQVILYALGFLHDFGYLYPKNSLVKFKVHIVQPRLNHIDTWEFDRVQLMTWVRDVLRPAVAATESDNAPFAAGEWCQFCKLRPNCTTRAEWMTSKFMQDIEDLSGLDEKIAALPDITMPSQSITLTNDQVAELLKHKAKMIVWLEDLNKYALNEIREGRPVGDWKLVAGKSARVFTESEEDVVASLELEGFSKDKLYTKPALLSVAQIEEKVTGKKNETFKSLYKKVEGAPVLAPGKDKRPSIVVDALTEFDNLGNWDVED